MSTHVVTHRNRWIAFQCIFTLLVIATLLSYIVYPLSLSPLHDRLAALVSPYSVQVFGDARVFVCDGALFCGLIVLRVIAHSFGVSFRTPISGLPVGFLLIMPVLVTLEIAAFQPMYPFVAAGAQWTLLLWYFSFFLEDAPTRTRVAQAPQVIAPPTTRAVSQCSICQKPGKYEVCLVCQKRHRHENMRVQSQLYRAKKAGVAATLTLPEWIATLRHFQWHCAYCLVGKVEVMEHYLPIALGGGTTKDNCFPSCRACNGQKGAKHPVKGFQQ